MENPGRQKHLGVCVGCGGCMSATLGPHLDLETDSEDFDAPRTMPRHATINGMVMIWFNDVKGCNLFIQALQSSPGSFVRSFMCQNNYGKLFFPIVHLSAAVILSTWCVYNNNNNLFAQENFFLCKSNENRNEYGHVAAVDVDVVCDAGAQDLNSREVAQRIWSSEQSNRFKNRHNLHLMRLRVTEMGAFGLERAVWCRELRIDKLFIWNPPLSGGNIFTCVLSSNTQA